MPQDTTLYRWRKWTSEQRKTILTQRRQRQQPAHITADHTSIQLITAAYFENTPNIGLTEDRLAKLNGRTSFEWNGRDNCRGTQTWCKAAKTGMKSEGHFYASRNYVLHNPSHHG